MEFICKVIFAWLECKHKIDQQTRLVSVWAQLSKGFLKRVLIWEAFYGAEKGTNIIEMILERGDFSWPGYNKGSEAAREWAMWGRGRCVHSGDGPGLLLGSHRRVRKSTKQHAWPEASVSIYSFPRSSPAHMAVVWDQGSLLVLAVPWYLQSALYIHSLHICGVNQPRIGHIWGKKLQKVLKTKACVCCAPGQYLHNIYIVLGVVSNLELIYSTQADECTLCTNATYFYVKDWRVQGDWAPGTNIPQIPWGDFILSF